MSTVVSVAGNNYTIPSYGDLGWAQGNGNLSQFLVALAQNLSGGFAQYVNVGISPYIPVSGKTYLVASNSLAVTFNLPTAVGNFWFAVKDSGNNAATNNITIHRHGSEKIGGTAADYVIKGNNSYTVFLSDGTDWFILGNISSKSQTMLPNGTVLLPSLTFGTDLDMGLYRIGADNLGVAVNGAKVLDIATTGLGVTGTGSYSGALTLSPVTNQLVLGTTNTTTITAPAPASSAVYTIPDVGTVASFVMTELAQTINGVKTFSAAVISQSQVKSQVARTDTKGAGGLLLDTVTKWGFRAADNAPTNGFALDHYNGSAWSTPITISSADVTTFIGQLIGHGTSTNDSAASGYIGEYIESVVGSSNLPATGHVGDLTTISLTAGDWDVSALYYCERNGATITYQRVAITTVSGDDLTGAVLGSNYILDSANGTNADNMGRSIPSFRMSLSTTTNIYLKYGGVFTTATPQARGRLSARRVR